MSISVVFLPLPIARMEVGLVGQRGQPILYAMQPVHVPVNKPLFEIEFSVNYTDQRPVRHGN